MSTTTSTTSTPLSLLLQKLRDVTSQLTTKPLYAPHQAEYAEAVQLIESYVLAMSDSSWRAALSDGVVSDIIGFAIGSVSRDELSFVAVQAWLDTMDALLVRTKPAANPTHLVLQLWDTATRMARDRSSESGTLTAVLQLLRVMLQRRPMSIDCIPRQHLPHPLKTVGITPRLAALELLPLLILHTKHPTQNYHHHQQQHTERCTNHNVQKIILTSPWFEYLRKSLTCPIPAIRGKAVETICVLLHEGLSPDATQITNLLDLIMRLVEGGEMSPKVQNDLGTAVGRLMALSQRGAGWSHFAATNASDSARITARIFQYATMTRSTQRILSIAIGELLFILATSPTSVDEAINCVFGLLVPLRNDERTYMPPIVSRAVQRWASLVGSDMVRVAIVRSLTRFLDTSSGKTATHTALLCLEGVLLTTVATSDFDVLLWAQLLLVPQRHPTLAQAASEAAASLAQRSEMCGRTLLRDLYTACGEIEPEKVLMPSFTLRAKVLLAMPSWFLRRPVVLETLLAVVASLSIDTPPPRVEGAFLRRVTYFNRLALLLLIHQRERLAPAVIANIKTSVRVFLSLLVSNPSEAPLYGRAASSACGILVELGTGDLELKLVVALLEAVEATGGEVGMQLRAAAYALLGGALWSACSDDVGKRGVLVQALADVTEAIRSGVPCVASGVEGEKDDMLLLPLLFPPQVSCAVLAEYLDDRQRMLPAVSEKSQAHVAYCAVQSIIGGCANGEQMCLQRVFDNLTEWRNMIDGDVAVTAWNVLRCLDGIFANCKIENLRKLTVSSPEEWFVFVTDHWLSSDVWVVRLAAAQLLARLAVITDRRDDFTSNAVKGFDVNAETYRLSGTILALGEMHGDYVTPTASMAISFVARVLKQQRGLRGDTTIVTTALLALIRMVPKHENLIKSTVSTTLLPQLLVPASIKPLEPIVSSLLLTLSSMLSLHIPPQQDNGIRVCVREFVYSAASCQSLSAGGISSILREVQRNVKDLKQVVKTYTDVTNTFVLDVAVVKRRVWGIMESAGGHLSDEVSREIANVLDACYSVNSSDVNNVSLLQVVSMIDTASSDETRGAWMNLARTIVLHACCDGYRHLGTCIQQMELVVRGKPPQQSEEREENMKMDSSSNGTHEAEEKRLSSGAHKKRGLNTAGVGIGVGAAKGETAMEVTSEVASKVAVVTLMTEILEKQLELQQQYDEGICFDLPAMMDADKRASLIRVLLTAASLAEVMPSMIAPAVSALHAILRLYGGRPVNGTLSVSPLLPWRVLLVNALQSVISRAVFCCDAACGLAETFLVCGVADDAAVRRITTALTLLLTALDVCEADADAVAARTSVSVSTTVRHGGGSRVLIALAACSGKCAAAAETIASASGQAAAALMCNQLTTSIALAHGYEPAHDMASAPLDDCAHATPAAALAVLSCMCAVANALGPTVRHAAGCLVCLLLCMRCVPLRPMLGIVPLLSTKHQEIIWEVSFKLLQSQPSRKMGMGEQAELGDEALSDGDAADVLEMAAATMCEKSAEEVESLLATMTAHHRGCVGSLGALRLALQASCRVECIERLLRHINVNAILTCQEKIVEAMAQYVQKLSTVEQKHLALSSRSGLVLMLLLPPTNNGNPVELLTGTSLSETVMMRLAEALKEAEEPLLLLQRVFPRLQESVRVCGMLLALCLSVRSPVLQQRWSPCVEHVLLSIIHSETMQRENHSPEVLKRITLFVRGVLLLLSTTTAETVRSRHPSACAALTKQLLQENANELREVIQSLPGGEAAALRKLMQLQGVGNSAGTQRMPQEYRSNNEVQPQGRATVIPQRLTINVASYTKV
ncbi:uncharacterized protein TM35_000141320 [Trypanosoma theileri]|uniref:Uncharacterized protein n=1 Tax=Trypanosoma theileri TaxID=67003 RepID=A0A1X0NWC5_9TRYP|nr:uncharacterized protein TM35_000141320 [Trypanosoma theileri]ORC88921.1 hypothetical protein TM35_000141320 [Trypanosoma theileri]